MQHLYYYIDLAFDIYYWILIARIVLSWIPHDPYQPIINFIYEMTDPFLRPFQRIIPPIGMVDISPIIAFIALGFIKRILLGLFI